MHRFQLALPFGVAALLAAAAAAVACGGSSGREIVVRAGERDAQHMYFDPKEIHVEAGGNRDVRDRERGNERP